MDLSPLAKMLDPEWIKQYVAAIRELNIETEGLGAEGFKKIMEIERVKIDLLHDANMKEIQAKHEAEMARLREDDKLKNDRFDHQNKWWKIDLGQLMFPLAVVVALLIAVLKG